MNLIYKTKKIVALVGVVLILSPTTALAATSSQSGSNSGTATNKANNQAREQEKIKMFCANLSNSTRPVVDNIRNNRDQVNKYWMNKQASLDAQWAQGDKKASVARASSDAKRTANNRDLINKAKTNAQKQAVNDYQKTLMLAENQRRDSNREANYLFRQGVNKAIVSRKTADLTQLDIFQRSVNSAIRSAQNKCSSNPSDISSIRATLQAELRSAREGYMAYRTNRNSSPLNQEIQQLIARRNAELNKANAQYKAIVSEARSRLLSAFAR